MKSMEDFGQRLAPESEDIYLGQRSQLSTQASSITSSKDLIDIVHDLFAQHYIQSCATISLPQLQVCPTLSDGIGD